MCGKNTTIPLYHRYQRRVDTIDIFDWLTINQNQEQAFYVTMGNGEKTLAQPGHYLNEDIV